MNICIFGAASSKIDQVYIDAVEKLGAELARHGHTLVFGGGAEGLMGAAARGFSSENGEIIGIIPSFFLDNNIEPAYTKCTDLIVTETMSERKRTMENMADAYIITPGGIGTFDEYFEVLTDKQLGRHKKPIVVYNVNHYYDDMEKVMASAIEKKFIKESCVELYEFTADLDRIVAYIENYVPSQFSIFDYKANQ